MELKYEAVRLHDAAAWLSQRTGKRFTADDLLDAADQLPICALIPRSQTNPRFSGPVQRAFRANLIEVARATDIAALGGSPTEMELAETAAKSLPVETRLRLEWEKEGIEQGVYELRPKDVRLLMRHGVQRLSRAAPALEIVLDEGFPSWIASRGFRPWLHKAIEFGKPVDVNREMLCVLRSHLVRYAEQFASQQAAFSAPTPEPAREQKAKQKDKAGIEEPHQGEQAAEHTPVKRAAIIDRLARRYPALESALDRPEEWAKACRVPDRKGWYYLERIEAECRARYGGAAPTPAADMSPAAQLSRIGR